LKAFDHFFGIGVILIAAAFAFSVYVKNGQTTESILWAIYTFGAFFLPGIYTVYPGSEKQTDSRGFEVKIPRGRKLSKFQSASIVTWIVGLGLVIVYVTQF